MKAISIADPSQESVRIGIMRAVEAGTTYELTEREKACLVDFVDNHLRKVIEFIRSHPDQNIWFHNTLNPETDEPLHNFFTAVFAEDPITEPVEQAMRRSQLRKLVGDLISRELDMTKYTIDTMFISPIRYRPTRKFE